MKTCPPCNHNCDQSDTCPARQLSEDGVPLTRNDYEELVILSVIAVAVVAAVAYFLWNLTDALVFMWRLLS